MTRTQKLFSLLLGTVLLPASYADTVYSDEDIMIVTATRSPQSQADIIPSTIVLTRDDIEQAQTSDLAELLRFHAGLDIGRNGGPGQASSVFIRGTESNHTLVLIDGVEINPGTIGGAALQNIDPEIIERIEIVKGPRSALYGSEAIGGVINIITRNAKHTAIETHVGLGSFTTRKAGFNGSMREESHYASLSMNWQDTDGFPTLDTEDEDRGFDNLSLNFKGGATLFGTNFELTHWQADGTTEYFDFFSNPVDQDYKNQSTALKIEKDLNANWNSKLILANAIDEIDQNQPNFLGSFDFVKTDRITADWINSYRVSSATRLLGGAYYAREKTKAVSFASPYSDPTEIKAVFVGADTQLGQLKTFTNLRYTDHDTAGDQISWNLEASYPLGDTVKIGLTTGSAFRAPDATDRFLPFFSNPNLTSEESQSYALNLKADTRLGDFHAEAFHTEIDDLITFGVNFIPFNVDKARIQGIELGHAFGWNQFDINTTALIQSPKNETTDSLLLRRARRSLSSDIKYKFDAGHNIGMQTLLSSERQDFSGALPGYALLNLTGKYQLNERIGIFGKIENLLDKEYQTAAGFNQSERAYYLNVRLSY